MIVFGDLGLENGRSIPSLIQEVDQKNVDVIFHNGDLCYEFQEVNDQ